MNRNEEVFVVIPSYNEGEVLESVISELKEHFENILVINDGSTDNTEEVLKKLGVDSIKHPINLGQGTAIGTAFKYLKNKNLIALITFDADGQHSVKDAVNFSTTICSSDVDIIFGSRFLEHRENLPIVKRMVLSFITSIHNFLTGLQLTDTHNGLKAYKKECFNNIDIGISRFSFESEIISQVAKKKFKYRELPTNTIYTHYSTGKGQKLRSGLIILETLLIKTLKK